MGHAGTVYMDMLFDPPRHERLPINDDETSTARWPRKASRMPPSLC